MPAKFKTKIEQLLYSIQYIEGAVDLKKIALKLGLKIAEEDLPDSISGALDTRTLDKKILLNRNHSEVRKRFTLAHEIAHFVLHDFTNIHIDKKLFFRADTLTNKQEREANLFAAELLMPEAIVRAQFALLQKEDWFEELDTDSLARYFKVSVPALLIRLSELRLLI
jgi:Zn-dependent peptidase ImmA (M78 family)